LGLEDAAVCRLVIRISTINQPPKKSHIHHSLNDLLGRPTGYTTIYIYIWNREQIIKDFCVCTLIEQKEPTPEIVDLPLEVHRLPGYPWIRIHNTTGTVLFKGRLKSFLGFAMLFEGVLRFWKLLPGTSPEMWTCDMHI
jgi:hypothetical protein